MIRREVSSLSQAHPLRRSVASLPRLACAVVLTLALCGKLAAQTTANITGVVTDSTQATIAGAIVKADGVDVAGGRSAVTDAHGAYHLVALAAGTYQLTVSRQGFATQVIKGLTLTLDRTATIDITLKVGNASEQVEVSGSAPFIDTTTPATGQTILPEDIQNIPLNGRNYVDLLEMVPGVTVNSQNDPGTDTALTILGERGNNTGYLIDGLNNSNQVTGGPSAEFNQDTIAEFQVLTSGYKAEFGHASGGIVNVITRTGGNDLHGLTSVFLRNNAIDSSDIPGTSTPYLLRWDYDAALGGTLIKDKVFWFGSAERIHENDQENFIIPPSAPSVLVADEKTYGTPAIDDETRAFGKLSELLGRHSLAQEFNYTNAHIGNFLPLSESTNLPSTRQNTGSSALMIGGTDTVAYGDQSSPYIMNVYGQFRDEPSTISPAHPQAGPYTIWNIFSAYNTGGIFGDLGQVDFGSLTSSTVLNQKYGSGGASLGKVWKRNTLKFGYDNLRTQVDGVEGTVTNSQLFATLADFATYGPINAGIAALSTTGGVTPQDSEIHLRNDYSGAYFQDDVKVFSKLIVNGGIRWDYDSAFNIKTNFAPRAGFSWSVSSKTVVRGSFGVFYDHFRLATARDIPAFGGASLTTSQPTVFPRLFYGIPTILPSLFGVCLSQTETDAQLAASHATCPSKGGPIYGVDHLNNIVAPGNGPIPANAVVNESNIQALSGLDPQTYVNEAAAAINEPQGYFIWGGPYNQLDTPVPAPPPGAYPVTVAPGFATPFTRASTLGIQHEMSKNFVISLDLYHKGIENILGTRITNIPFAARICANLCFAGPDINGFGPWYSGKYNAAILSFEKRYSNRYSVGGSYAFTSENDDAGCAALITAPQVGCSPTDSFIGTTTLVTDPISGQTNANGSFTASNGNFIPKAGIYWNGPKLDEGPSDFALRHILQVHGMALLPLKFQVSGIYRVQSGFHYSEASTTPLDEDGSGGYHLRGLSTGRNQFVAPHYMDQDLRIARSFTVHERFKVQPMIEFFNLFNSANPAAIQYYQSVTTPAFGSVSQYLNGRQGQAAIRIEF